MSLLQIGNEGLEVISLQKNLNQLGYNLVVDGKFGPNTKEAVRKFQIAKNIMPDGIVGRGTTICIQRDLSKLIDTTGPGNIKKVSFPWMDFMHDHIGEHELWGEGRNNPFIVAMFKHTDYQAETDETPWCAACVCTALEESGYKSSHRADAISYKDYGDPCEMKPGCIVVMQHPNGGHHVTFCDHIVDANLFAALGGNQSNSLRISVYSRSEIIATRWPVKE
ncbi:MAG: TIGR02594 family protein [Chlamydiales bacterium]